MGTYRVVLQVPGGELPFGLELESQGATTVGYLVNGKERLMLDEVKIDGTHLEIRMPGYETRLIADAAGDQLHGEVIPGSSWAARSSIFRSRRLGVRGIASSRIPRAITPICRDAGR